MGIYLARVWNGSVYHSRKPESNSPPRKRFCGQKLLRFSAGQWRSKVDGCGFPGCPFQSPLPTEMKAHLSSNLGVRHSENWLENGRLLGYYRSNLWPEMNNVSSWFGLVVCVCVWVGTGEWEAEWPDGDVFLVAADDFDIEIWPTSMHITCRVVAPHRGQALGRWVMVSK